MDDTEDLLIEFLSELAERFVIAIERIADAVDEAANDASSP